MIEEAAIQEYDPYEREETTILEWTDGYDQLRYTANDQAAKSHIDMLSRFNNELSSKSGIDLETIESLASNNHFTSHTKDRALSVAANLCRARHSLVSVDIEAVLAAFCMISQNHIEIKDSVYFPYLYLHYVK